MSTITRGSDIWELKEPGVVHYAVPSTMTTGRGDIGVHLNPRCSRMRDPMPLNAHIVDILWEADVRSDAVTDAANGVAWCGNCACRKVN